jgi:hypothetical protein
MEIYKLMGAVLADIGAVDKMQKNNSQGYKFRGVDDVYNAVHSAVKKHGIFCLPEIKKIIFREKIKSAKGQEGWHQILEISYKFCAPDGSFVECTVWGESADYGSDKTTNKCMSIAHKYALFQVFMIPVSEIEDPDKDSPLHDDMVYHDNQQRQQQQQRPNQGKQRPNQEQQHAQEIISEAEQQKVTKMKEEMINLVSTTENVDWIALTGKPLDQIITIISAETREERLKGRWKVLQKLLFELPEAIPSENEPEK